MDARHERCSNEPVLDARDPSFDNEAMTRFHGSGMMPQTFDVALPTSNWDDER